MGRCAAHVILSNDCRASLRRRSAIQLRTRVGERAAGAWCANAR
jgi:hypothetical protein